MAGNSGRDFLTLPRPWHRGIQGLSRDLRPGSSVSATSLNPQGAGCTGGMWACCSPAGLALEIGPCAGVTALARD